MNVLVIDIYTYSTPKHHADTTVADIIAGGYPYDQWAGHFYQAMLAGFCFVIGGGIGNVFDRIAYGSVTDFLHVKFGIFQTGIFNVADLSIMTGVVIILLQSILKQPGSS